MSNITLSNSEYADILLIELYNAIRKGSVLEENYRYKELIDVLKSRNIKSQLFRSYLDMDGNTRIMAKRFNKALESSDTARVTVLGKGETEHELKSIKDKLKKLVGLSEEIDAQFDRVLCKQIFKKVKEVRFKHMKPITEEVLDRIIDHCIEQYANQNYITEEDNDG